jgi:triosephosphate isomerase (TIM)
MNGSELFLKNYFDEFGLINAEKTEIIFCPPHVYLSSIKDMGYQIGGQNCHYEANGSYTGEISATMLKDLGCSYCIVGHSERRSLFGETSDNIAKKSETLLNAGIIPIICVGETLKQRESGQAVKSVSQQTQDSMPKNSAKCLIAYEPIWAIGSGKIPTAAEIIEIHAAIKNIYPDCPVLYGGSVNSQNAKDILSLEGVDGALVGGASLKPQSFKNIVNEIIAD